MEFSPENQHPQTAPQTSPNLQVLSSSSPDLFFLPSVLLSRMKEYVGWKA